MIPERGYIWHTRDCYHCLCQSTGSRVKALFLFPMFWPFYMAFVGMGTIRMNPQRKRRDY